MADNNDMTQNVTLWSDNKAAEIDVISDAAIERLAVDSRVTGVEADLLLEIARGNISGMKIMRGLGERESTGTTVTGEDIWRGNQLSSTPSAPASTTTLPRPADAGEQMTLISENDADNGATATGVLTVEIEYLDASGNEQTETVTMNGTTAVDTVATNIRFVNDMHSVTVGSNTVAEGHIRIYNKADDTLVYNMIASGGNQSLVPHRMVPLGKKLFLRQWTASEGNNKRLAVRLRADCNNHVPAVRTAKVFQFKSVVYLNQTSSSEITLADEVPALCVVKASAWGIVTNAECSVDWWGILVDDA